jgi:hypothetical protein
VVERGDIENWPRGERTFVTVSPDRKHDLVQTGKDIVAELHRRLGEDVSIACSVHRHEGHPHFHIAIDRAVPQYKVERAVDWALEQRLERTRDWARKQELDRRLEQLVEVKRDLQDLEQRARERDGDRMERGGNLLVLPCRFVHVYCSHVGRRRGL